MRAGAWYLCMQTAGTAGSGTLPPPASTFSTYDLLLPLTTRHTGRCTRSSRWWFSQKRTRVWMGNSRTWGQGAGERSGAAGERSEQHDDDQHTGLLDDDCQWCV
jgi:hypothetical protein